MNGHPAYYLPDLLLGTVKQGYPDDSRPRTEVRGMAVGWPDAAGAWVLVYDDAQSYSKAELAQVAGLVRAGAPRDIPMPYLLGYVPHGLPGTVLIADVLGPPPDYNTTIDFGGDPVWDSPIGPTLSAGGVPLEIQVLTRSDYGDGHISPHDTTTKIAGYDAWYYTGKNGAMVLPDAGSGLLLHVGRCEVRLTVQDRSQITYQDLVRLVENARFADCTDPGTWLPPLR